MYSNHSDNPLADYWHVIVPYCSSDTWAGTGSSEVTGYYFHGKHIFRTASRTCRQLESLAQCIVLILLLCRDVMNSLSHHYGLFSATDFVLSGSSAGGFGVGLNCDDTTWQTGCSPPTPA